ncbi:MAG: TauD/TfdA family dioxygenase [Rhizomicrobium sp.]
MGLHEKIKDIELKHRPVAGRIGAEISGVRLGGDLDAGTVAAIRQALLTHKVIFFPRPAAPDGCGAGSFRQAAGSLVPHPTVPKIEGTEVALNIISDGSYAANQWHTDVTFRGRLSPGVDPARRSLCRPRAADTVWANTAAAYEHLPAPLRELADKLQALHTNAFDYAASRPDASADRVKRHTNVFASTVYETEHPLVRVHPETGERTLLLGNFAQKIVGLNKDDSARLIAIFQDHITRLENTVRWHWALGDVAIWDNRATQHYGIGDFTEARELHRVTIDGDVPVGVDGKSSVTRRKEVRNPDLKIAAE